MIEKRDSPPSVSFAPLFNDWIFLASWFPWKQPSGNLTGGEDKGTTSSPEWEAHTRGHRIKGRRSRGRVCARVCVCERVSRHSI